MHLLNNKKISSLLLIKCYVASGFSQMSSGDMNCKFSLQWLTEQSTLTSFKIHLFVIHYVFIVSDIYQNLPKEWIIKTKKRNSKDISYIQEAS